jgi:hypothetical protein
MRDLLQEERMTLSEYTELRNREQAAEWMNEIGIGFAPKKSRFKPYVMLLIMGLASVRFWIKAAIELSN